MTSDEVNSISDTAESMQVATIVQTVYFNMATRADLPEHMAMFQLTASGDPTLPILMYRPSNVDKVQWIKYFNSNVLDGASIQSSQFGAYSVHSTNTNLQSLFWSTSSTTSNTIGLGTKTFVLLADEPISQGNLLSFTSGANVMTGNVTTYNSGTKTVTVNITSTIGAGTFTSWAVNPVLGGNAPPGYCYVTILPIQQFMDYVNSFNPNTSDTKSYLFTDNNGQTFTLYYKNQRQPQYCTVIGNFNFLFDSYDNTQDTTLQQSKTMCYGQTIPVFTMSDSFVPVLDDYQFPLLLNEAKALAWFELKQTIHPQASQEAKRQWVSVEKDKSIVNRPTYFDQLANFGRRIGTGGYATGYPQSWNNQQLRG